MLRKRAAGKRVVSGVEHHDRVDFDRGLAETAEWYRTHEDWWRPIKQGNPEFRAYYETQYGHRS